MKDLSDMKAENLNANELAPLVSARLNSKQITALADKSYVAGIYMSRISQPALNISVPTVLAPAVWARGITGAGSKVAIIDPSGIAFSTNPYLTGANRLNTCFADAHATIVAGVVGSRQNPWFGVAYDAFLLGAETCDFADASVITATTWAYNNDAHVFNNSWNQCNPNGTTPYMTSMSRFHDQVVRDWFRVVIDSAGNYGNPNCSLSDHYVLPPANAYNVIAVGAFDDRNTTDWSDDGMASFSQYLNPSSGHNDRQKPEIAAPGVGIISTYLDPSQVSISDGTSVAAPHVSGAAALLQTKAPGLAIWPEALKAILMATATHNIEGSTRLSEYDGAGGLNVDRADALATDNHVLWVGDAVNPYYPTDKDYYFNASAGQKVRAVIVWDADPNYAAYDIQPGMDLDLSVYDPNGTVVGGSASYDNTYEIVEFTAQATGQYRLNVHKCRVDEIATWLGVAWNAY